MQQPQVRLPGYQTVARTATRDCPVALLRKRGHYVITSCGRVLMTSDDTGSERELGRLTARLLRGTARPQVLVGGLGMGYTLRALLDRLPRRARVVVSELLPPVARWNQERLGHLAAHPMADRRVSLHLGDVASLVRGRPEWDAITLDVDNGPDWIVQKRNRALYGREGLNRLIRSLRPRGFLSVWSAGRHRPFERRMTAMGLQPRRFQPADSRGRADVPTLYLMRRPLQPRRAARRRPRT
jgi:spermidine synthase